jgi:cytochrome c1
MSTLTRIATAAAVAAGLTLGLGATGASAAGGGEGPSLKRPSWTFEGVFGMYDEAQLRRGWQVYAEVCKSCHPLARRSSYPRVRNYMCLVPVPCLLPLMFLRIVS